MHAHVQLNKNEAIHPPSNSTGNGWKEKAQTGKYSVGHCNILGGRGHWKFLSCVLVEKSHAPTVHGGPGPGLGGRTTWEVRCYVLACKMPYPGPDSPSFASSLNIQIENHLLSSSSSTYKLQPPISTSLIE